MANDTYIHTYIHILCARTQNVSLISTSFLVSNNNEDLTKILIGIYCIQLISYHNENLVQISGESFDILCKLQVKGCPLQDCSQILSYL